MTNSKILKTHNKFVAYDEEHWRLLREKRTKAKVFLNMFNKEGLNPFVIGSIARGDIHPDSDIDVIFTQVISPFKIEYILSLNGFRNYFREIIMATPMDALKMYIYISELESISFPITKLNKISLEFYDFGGKLDLQQVKDDVRTLGINKRLVLIEPMEKGHRETSIMGKEHIVAKQLQISVDTLLERKKVLLKRERLGKTGVFIKKELGFGESTEEVLKNLAKQKSIVRKKLREF